MSFDRRGKAVMAFSLVSLSSLLPIARAFSQASVQPDLYIAATIQADPADDSSPISYKVDADVHDVNGAVLIPAGSTPDYS